MTTDQNQEAYPWESAEIRGESASALLAVSDNAHTQSVPSEANSRVVSSFIDYLKSKKGLGALTVSAYTRDIGQFAAVLDRSKRTLLNARRDDVRGFLQQLFSNSVDGRSVARKLSALRHLYRFLSARQAGGARPDAKYSFAETMEGVAQGAGTRRSGNACSARDAPRAAASSRKSLRSAIAL